MNFDFSLDPEKNLLSLIQEAAEAGIKEPTAMVLATVNKNSEPSGRVVLFKGFQNQSLTFYTNYNSPKSENLKTQNKVSLVFYWPELSSQVRISGEAIKLSRKENEAYFQTRPYLSQISAWASEQSQQLESYQQLEEKVALLMKKYKENQVPCPEHWGGYAVTPAEYEFWFAKPGRLHERYFYKKGNSDWHKSLLSP